MAGTGAKCQELSKRATLATPPKKSAPDERFPGPTCQRPPAEDSTSSLSLQVSAQMKERVRAEANPPSSPSHRPNPMLV